MSKGIDEILNQVFSEIGGGLKVKADQLPTLFKLQDELKSQLLQALLDAKPEPDEITEINDFYSYFQNAANQYETNIKEMFK